VRAVVLVEGPSDAGAVEALAAHRGRDLAVEGVGVVTIGGAQALGRELRRYGPPGLDVAVAGLYDAGEERVVQRALAGAGLEPASTREELQRLGFFVCERDLEDELIRALGADRVEAIVEAKGDLGRFRTLQKQPEWRGRPLDEQLRRFFGSGGRRKIRYAPLLVEALVELDRVPRPLEGVLASI
jgi:hypothetical protein